MKLNEVKVGEVYEVRLGRGSRAHTARVRITGRLQSRQTGMLDGFRTVRGFPFEWVEPAPEGVAGEIVKARYLREVLKPAAVEVTP